jgi:photosystem II stability/assembly factor-like uncharacterized protein
LKKQRFFLYSFILSLILITNAIAQEGWFWQNPLPQGNNLTDVCFVDENTGYVLGYNLTFMKTTDGGDTWSYITVPTNRTINGTFFIDTDNGTAVGNYGTILTTTDGGQSWSTQISGQLLI